MEYVNPELTRVLKINALYETFRVTSEDVINQYQLGYITAVELIAGLKVLDIHLTERLKSVK